MKWMILLAPLAFTVLILLADGRASGASATQPCFRSIFGDLNENGQIDVSDAHLEKAYVLGRDPDFPCGPYDVDCDGSISVADASKIKQAALGHPYHQNEPCPDIGAVESCIDFNVDFPCPPEPTPAGCIDFSAAVMCEPFPGPTPEPGPTPVDCIDFSADGNCGPFSRSQR